MDNHKANKSMEAYLPYKKICNNLNSSEHNFQGNLYKNHIRKSKLSNFQNITHRSHLQQKERNQVDMKEGTANLLSSIPSYTIHKYRRMYNPYTHWGNQYIDFHLEKILSFECKLLL